VFRDVGIPNASGIVQVLATHAVTLCWNVSLVQMHCWSVGAQALVLKAERRHFCYHSLVLAYNVVGIERDLQRRQGASMELPAVLQLRSTRQTAIEQGSCEEQKPSQRLCVCVYKVVEKCAQKLGVPDREPSL
jgi:hypothetical protein